jgi:signal transduction histidine kinase
LLDLSKIESGRAEWHESQVDVKEVISDSVAGMQQVFEEKGIRVDLRLPESAPRVPGDVDRIIQVMLNLLSNAVKFCEPGAGRIEIALSQGRDGLRVDVRDNGPGVSVEDQALIFDKFRQAGDTLTNKPQGTGLAAYAGISWSTTAQVRSKATGEGAAPAFTLPIEQARTSTLRPRRPEPDAKSG